MTNNAETIINDDTLIAIYDGVTYFWLENTWQELPFEVMNLGTKND